MRPSSWATAVHVMPSGEDWITPPSPTATNAFCTTPTPLKGAGAGAVVRPVQAMPSVEVKTRLLPPLTATKVPLLKASPRRSVAPALLRSVQVEPSGEVTILPLVAVATQVPA